MIVAVFGSRKGYDLNHLGEWLHALWTKQGPTTELVSGGAEGVDKNAETTWLAFGGAVTSFRPIKLNGPFEDDKYAIETVKLGIERPMVFIDPHHPTFADFSSAATYRDMVIAEYAERGAGFRYNNSRGTTLTVGFFECLGKPVYLYDSSHAAQES